MSSKNRDLWERSRKLDCIYAETNRLYSEVAKSCGLSDCAYWIMYEIEVAGGAASVRSFVETSFSSRQTINSALKTLVAKGLITLDFEAGSHKNKAATFTEAGREFSRRRIQPAIEAEASAFGTLLPADQDEILRLASSYAAAVRAQLEALVAKEAAND